MSNYTSTPTFGGSSNQWPPTNPPLQSPMPSIFPPNFPFSPDSSGTQNAPINMNNFDANSRLPGLGVGAPGPLPPPPFPFPGTPSQFPPAPFPLQMPLLGYPPIPLPMQIQTNPPATSDNTSGHTVNAMGRQQDYSAKSRLNYDQEEGEVTDGENVGFVRPGGEKKGQPGRVASAYSLPVQMETDALSNNPTTNCYTQSLPRNSEEGEASVSCASSRASGSPYNPPMSVTAASPVSEHRSGYNIHEQPMPPGQDNEKEQPRGQFNSRKSPDQLRIQAQGALLGLAPHNIRFEELVGEGISPALLRQLYEEVGIKVPTLPVATGEQAQSAAAEPASFTNGVGPAQRQGTDSTTKSPSDLQQSPVGRPASASQSDTTKPMERKEVIARMLAAKAAKASGPSPSPQDVAKETSTIPNTVVPLSRISGKEKEIPVREKNKAQTELARQRIEQLKKQGLMRNQKTQQDTASQDQLSRTTAPPLSVPMAGQHPLPERPPEREVSSARLPGLFMTGSDQIPAPDPHATPIQNLPLDPTPQPRVTQRKRPRASDFDDINDFSRRGLGHGAGDAAPEDRLVIDISDDEFYEENEDDAMDLEEPQSFENFSSSADFPTSLTPRNNDQEHLRQKDMEIQAMHRKIAELEQRKKAKLDVNHSQSSRATNASMDAGLESDDVTPAEPAIANEYNDDGIGVALGAALMEPATSRPNGLVAVPPTKPLASMDSTELQTIRSKILRKQTIESGLPGLDAEIASSEAKLFFLKQEEDNVLSTIAKGKQGRQQLIRELEYLGIEINGLTLDELDAAQRKLESDEASLPAEKAPPLAPTVNEDDFPMADIPLPTKNREESQSIEEASPVEQEPQAEPDHDPTFSADLEREAPHAYSSDSTGSSMDESTDTSSVSSDSDSQEESDDEDMRSPGRDFAEDAERPAEDEETQKETRTESHPPFSVHAPAPDDGSSGEESYEPGDVDGDDRMSSAESEGYEPPEPEQDSGSVESEYTPPPLTGEEPEVSPGPLPDQSQAEPLTGDVQEVIADSGHVQSVPEVQAPDHKFTPYESPLRHFKSYRYHPNYSDLVSEGYRSLTYSHDINSMKHLCPFESTGGVCNDRSCEYQHFRDMTLSDDKILVQMGSLREGKTSEEKDQYIAGLKQIINDMRRDKVKDFNTVATEIAAYRRRFLHDPTRVLPL